MGGGPSPEQRNAAQSQANLTNQLGQVFGQQENFLQAQQNKVNPFYTNLMQNGSPYTNIALDQQGGLNAQAFAPARAQLYRQTGSNPGLPNGFQQQALTDLSAQQARSYDQGLQGVLGNNLAIQQSGASGLLGQAQIANPVGYASGALQGNQSIMQAPLQRPGLGGLLGGL